MTSFTRRVTLISLAGAVMAGLLTGGSAALASGSGKISLMHESATLVHSADTTTNVLQPTEPIVCSDQNAVCDVTLDFSASLPVGVSMSSGGVFHWTASEWFQIRGFTLTLDDATQFTPGQVVTLTATAVSNSEYYSAFVVTLPVTIGETGGSSETPTADPGVAYASGGLANTGLSAVLAGPLSLALGSIGLATILAVRKSRRRTQRREVS